MGGTGGGRSGSFITKRKWRTPPKGSSRKLDNGPEQQNNTNNKEKEALKSHNCVLIYKSETEGDENRTPDRSLIGLTTKMLKVKRLEEFNTCYNSNQLEKMAFFQCREEVEKVKCFLGENSGDQDSRSEQNEAKEKLWSDAGLAERMPVQSKRTSALAVDVPAPPAPFDHRIVTAKQAAVNSFYTVSKTEILGGGRFGQVHKCEETATGLKLAAKIIKTRGMKDKEEVKNEISVMNQLDHANLIQLYDAFESKNDIVLVMEYVDGGELFDRIIDENYNLTELDTILFMKQICEGIRHMHQMYILHLDLKPENILCVSRDAKQIKIIDFGLARRYKPREKLKVNFGTPEFLAPEVVNYDFVSFPTDMWSVGVIAYMLLSGLSPFLGDNDAETLNNILACRWDLEDEEFQEISDEAKEFISKLLIKEKSWRISASEALKHPWLSDHKLHSRLNAQKKKKNRGSDVQDFVTK
ncbi:myosin light chain kinase family member 4 isoform X3 [Callithrix jacchus]